MLGGISTEGTKVSGWDVQDTGARAAGSATEPHPLNLITGCWLALDHQSPLLLCLFAPHCTPAAKQTQASFKKDLTRCRETRKLQLHRPPRRIGEPKQRNAAPRHSKQQQRNPNPSRCLRITEREKRKAPKRGKGRVYDPVRKARSEQAMAGCSRIGPAWWTIGYYPTRRLNSPCLKYRFST
jgi:hypothetical protein